MANNERVHWTPHVGALRDAAPKGSFESVSAIDRRVQTYGTEVWITTEGERRHRLLVFINLSLVLVATYYLPTSLSITCSRLSSLVMVLEMLVSTT
jgi:hypothetical protein